MTAKPDTKPAKASAPAELPVLSFAGPKQWAEWLAQHHAAARGVWLQLAKKASGIPSVTYAEALTEALCWGWIDGQKKSHDDTAFLQKFTPRGKKSTWSKINREKVLALISEGRMQPSGQAEIDRAQNDGRWDLAYDSPSRATVPEDLATAFVQNPRAAAFFATLNASNRYAVLFRIQTAKKPETRQKRIVDLVAMLARHEKIHA